MPESLVSTGCGRCRAGAAGRGARLAGAPAAGADGGRQRVHGAGAHDRRAAVVLAGGARYLPARAGHLRGARPPLDILPALERGRCLYVRHFAHAGCAQGAPPPQCAMRSKPSYEAGQHFCRLHRWQHMLNCLILHTRCYKLCEDPARAGPHPCSTGDRAWRASVPMPLL